MLKLIQSFSDLGVTLGEGKDARLVGNAMVTTDTRRSTDGNLDKLMAFRTENPASSETVLAAARQRKTSRDEMLLTAKEQSIASKSQLKGHAHHYFLSPYRNLPRPTDGLGISVANADDREGDNRTRLSHPDTSSFSPHRDQYSPNAGNETSRSLPTEPNPLPARDKLPPIGSFRKSHLRSQKDNNRWLGPPNSIPPNKRSEHIAAYKNVSRPHRITPLHADTQDAHETQSNVSYTHPPRLYHDFRPDELEAPYGATGEEGASSGYPDSDSYSAAGDAPFTQLYLKDPSFAKHLSSAGQSLRLRSHTHHSSTRYDAESTDHYSTAAILNGYAENQSDSLSVYSSHSLKQRRKRVHFDPEVRDVSRENRSAPLTAQHTQQAYYTEASQLPMRFQLDINPGMDTSVDQLPAVVEKYMIKSLPVLPNINKPVNANIIYIKGHDQGNSGGGTAMSRPVLIPRNNVIHVSSSGAASSQPVVSAASQYGSPRVHRAGAGGGAAIAPQLARLTEESSVGSSSPSPQLKHSSTNRLATSTTATATTSSSGDRKTFTSSTHAHAALSSSHQPSTHTSQPTAAAQHHKQQAALAHSTATNQSSTPVNPNARTGAASKKSTTKKTSKGPSTEATSNKKSSGSTAKNSGSEKTVGKAKNRKGRSSGSSSRNSPTGNGLDTPPETAAGASGEAVDEEEQRERRQREYAEAMLKVQQRMREFDLRYGKKPKQTDEDLEQFGKAIPGTLMAKSTTGHSKTKQSRSK